MIFDSVCQFDLFIKLCVISKLMDSPAWPCHEEQKAASWIKIPSFITECYPLWQPLKNTVIGYCFHLISIIRVIHREIMTNI